MTDRTLPCRITIGGVEMVRTPHPNPALTAWAGNLDGDSVSVLYSLESDYRSRFWHVSVARTPAPPTQGMLADAVEAIIGPGTAYEVEPTANPNVLHAFEPEVVPA